MEEVLFLYHRTIVWSYPFDLIGNGRIIISANLLRMRFGAVLEGNSKELAAAAVFSNGHNYDDSKQCP